MLLIPGDTLNMGGDNDQADPNEFPKHKVEISPFWMDEMEVTNAQFAEFIEVTGYVTVAERPVVWEEIKKSYLPERPSHLIASSSQVPWFFKRQNSPCRWTTPAAGGSGPSERTGDIRRAPAAPSQFDKGTV